MKLPKKHYLFACGSGALLPLAFAPFNLWPLAIIMPAVLLYLTSKTLPKQSFKLGYLFGIGYFLVGVSWVYVSIHDFGHSNFLVAGMLTLLFVLYLALFPALTMYTTAKTHRLLFPVIWVLFEWLRSSLFTGFPWLLLGYSQINSYLKSYAPIGGIYLVSLMILITSYCLLLKNKKTNIIILIFIWAVGFKYYNIPINNPNNKQLKISLIQGNLSPNDKFLLDDPINASWQAYGTQMQDVWDSDVIVWPENAIPLPLPWSQEYLNKLDKIAKQHNTALLIGMPVATDDRQNYFNAIVGLGTASGRYYKRHLVPFGEYLPFDKYLRGLINFFDLPMSNFVTGNRDDLVIPDIKFAYLICYEIAYPQLINKSDIDAILTISEDGWFGNSWGPHQHLDIARMRALETGKYVIRATTSGISTIIDPQGNVIMRSPQFVPWVLTSHI